MNADARVISPSMAHALTTIVGLFLAWPSTSRLMSDREISVKPRRVAVSGVSSRWLLELAISSNKHQQLEIGRHGLESMTKGGAPGRTRTALDPRGVPPPLRRVARPSACPRVAQRVSHASGAGRRGPRERA
jgi:hypothetical protein